MFQPAVEESHVELMSNKEIAEMITRETTDSEEATEVTRDCRNWSEMEYIAVKEDGEDTLVIENDAENHDHRLTSWIKVNNTSG